MFVEQTPNPLKEPVYYSSRIRDIVGSIKKSEIVLFDGKKLENLPFHSLTEDKPVLGGIKTIRKLLNKFSFREPPNIDIPQCFNSWEFLKRNISVMTVEEVLGLGREVHIKSALEQKKFIGFVYNPHNNLHKLFLKETLGKNYKLQVSDKISMANENRLFFYDKECLNLKKRLPSETDSGYSKRVGFINALSWAYKGATRAWIVDIAYNSNTNSWVLVEANNVWSASLKELDSDLKADYYFSGWKDLIDSRFLL